MTTTAVDPVCGMQVNPEIATAQGLSSEHDGQTYFFCGKGCKLDFDEDPARYFDPGYAPHVGLHAYGSPPLSRRTDRLAHSAVAPQGPHVGCAA